jgi:NAD(P)-dependent dehydrogenase (short-subunit alcohol dehydrogenase family)
MALVVDITERAALEPAFQRIEANSPVDILVNNPASPLSARHSPGDS